jgi:hypothetical protein
LEENQVPVEESAFAENTVKAQEQGDAYTHYQQQVLDEREAEEQQGRHTQVLVI